MAGGDVTVWVAVGSLVAALLGAVGAAIVRDRSVWKAISEGDEKLHARVNDVRDQFVRRDDLNGHLTRIEATIGSLHQDLRRVNERMDDMYDVLRKAPGKGASG